MTDQPGDSAGLISSDERRRYAPEPPAVPERQDVPEEQPTYVPEPEEPITETLPAHLAGVERTESGAATLWLSDDITTMHFPLTEATVPALLAELDQLAEAHRRPRAVGPPDARAHGPEYEDYEDAADYAADGEDLQEGAERPGRLARWTGWHYSNTMVSRIPPQQRVALFAAIVVILLLITLFDRL